jgi:4-nitrophenyl phosphatase
MKRRASRPPRSPRITGLVFDLDGTLILSDRALGRYEVLPGAAEILTQLAQSGIPYAVFTNGSAYPPAAQAAKLRAHGLPVGDEQMLTPSSVAAHLMRRRKVRRALVLGTPGTGQALRDAGIEVVHPNEQHEAAGIDAVYVGWYPDCTMRCIEAACLAIWAGARLYAASDVPFFATKQGRTMGYSCAIIGAIRHLTRAPMTLTGKPSREAMRFAIRRLGRPLHEIAVVGDDPEVDIGMARRAGAHAFAVLSGVTTVKDWRAERGHRRPHRVLGGLEDLELLVTAPG